MDSSLSISSTTTCEGRSTWSEVLCTCRQHQANAASTRRQCVTGDCGACGRWICDAIDLEVSTLFNVVVEAETRGEARLLLLHWLKGRRLCQAKVSVDIQCAGVRKDVQWTSISSPAACEPFLYHFSQIPVRSSHRDRPWTESTAGCEPCHVRRSWRISCCLDQIRRFLDACRVNWQQRMLNEANRSSFECRSSCHNV